jgi:hypothetical protein
MLCAFGAACSSSDDTTTSNPATSTTTHTTAAPPTPTPSNPPTTASSPGDDTVEGTIVRFASSDTHVDVTVVADNPTSRNFLSMLPLVLSFEEFNGREKISYLPQELDTDGCPAMTPKTAT